MSNNILRNKSYINGKNRRESPCNMRAYVLLVRHSWTDAHSGTLVAARIGGNGADHCRGDLPSLLRTVPYSEVQPLIKRGS
jgi:hypothetical protein